MNDEAHRRVRAAAADARSSDDMVGKWWWEETEPAHPLDEDTLDETASTQLGEMYEQRRRGAS